MRRLGVLLAVTAALLLETSAQQQVVQDGLLAGRARAAGAALEGKNDGAARGQDGRLRARKWVDHRKEDAEGWAANGQARATEAGGRVAAGVGDAVNKPKDLLAAAVEGEEDEQHRHLQSFRPGRTAFVAAQQAVSICKGAFTQGRRMVGSLSTNLRGWVTGSAFTGMPRRMSAHEDEEEEGAHRHLAAGRGQGYKQKGERWAKWGSGRADDAISSAQDNSYVRDNRPKEAATPSLLTGWFSGGKDVEVGASPFHDPDERVYSMKLFAEMGGQKDALDDRVGRYQALAEFEENYFRQWAIRNGWMHDDGSSGNKAAAKEQEAKKDALGDRLSRYQAIADWEESYFTQWAIRNGWMHDDGRSSSTMKASATASKEQAAPEHHDPDERVYSMKLFAEQEAKKDALDDRLAGYQAIGEFESNFWQQWAIRMGYAHDPNEHPGGSGGSSSASTMKASATASKEQAALGHHDPDERVYSMKLFAEKEAEKDALDDRLAGYQAIGEFESNFWQQWAIRMGYAHDPNEQGGHRRLDALDDRVQRYQEMGDWWAEWGRDRADYAIANAQANGYMHEDPSTASQQQQYMSGTAGNEGAATGAAAAAPAPSQQGSSNSGGNSRRQLATGSMEDRLARLGAVASFEQSYFKWLAQRRGFMPSEDVKAAASATGNKKAAKDDRLSGLQWIADWESQYFTDLAKRRGYTQQGSGGGLNKWTEGYRDTYAPSSKKQKQQAAMAIDASGEQESMTTMMMPPEDVQGGQGGK